MIKKLSIVMQKQHQQTNNNISCISKSQYSYRSNTNTITNRDNSNKDNNDKQQISQSKQIIITENDHINENNKNKKQKSQKQYKIRNKIEFDQIQKKIKSNNNLKKPNTTISIQNHTMNNSYHNYSSLIQDSLQDNQNNCNNKNNNNNSIGQNNQNNQKQNKQKIEINVNTNNQDANDNTKQSNSKKLNNNINIINNNKKNNNNDNFFKSQNKLSIVHKNSSIPSNSSIRYQKPIVHLIQKLTRPNSFLLSSTNTNNKIQQHQNYDKKHIKQNHPQHHRQQKSLQSDTQQLSPKSKSKKGQSFLRTQQKKKSSQMRNSFHNPFKFIHTLMNMKCTGSGIAKTIKSLKQNIIIDQIKRKQTEKSLPFLQPDQFLRSVLEQYTNTIKISQVKYYTSTKKGIRNYQTLQNQDVILIERIANIHKLFGIFDGHGQYGKSVANLSASYFKSCLKSYQQQFKRQIVDTQIVNIVKSCIKKTQSYLLNFKYNQIQQSGTTALIVLVSPRNIFSFNLGNSRLIIGMSDQNGQNVYDFQVTHDHDLNRLDQRIRCKEVGAIIMPLKDQLGENYGPDRLWNKDQKRPGTYITRALGLAGGVKVGIISQPQVSVLTFNKRMRFLVLASDGLWFVQQNDEVIQYLNRYYESGQLNMGVTGLMQEACKRWKSKNQLMDDITIIIVTLAQEK